MLGFFKGKRDSWFFEDYWWIGLSDNVVSHRILSLSGLEPWPGFIWNFRLFRTQTFGFGFIGFRRLGFLDLDSLGFV